MQLLWTTVYLFIFQVISLTAIYALLFRSNIVKKIHSTNLYVVFFAAIVGLQIVTSFLYKYEVIDVMIQAGAGWHLRHKIDFYFIDPRHEQHPYLPFMMFFFAVANAVQEALPIFTFMFFVKMLLLASILVISWQIKKSFGAEGRVTQLRFLAHPITTMVVFFHGQFDGVLLAFAVFAILFLQFRKGLMNFLIGAGLFTASVLTKTWSVIFLPVLVWEEKRWWKRVALPVLMLAGVVADVFVYTRIVDGSRVRAVLPAALKAGGPIGEWGISFILSPWAAFLKQYNLVIFAGLCGLLLLPVIFSKLNIWQKCLLTLLAVYIAIPNWGIQYLFWCLPFVYLAKEQNSKFFKWFTVLASISLFGNYINVIWSAPVIAQFPLRLFGLTVWGVIIWWYWSLVSSTREKIRYNSHSKPS